MNQKELITIERSHYESLLVRLGHLESEVEKVKSETPEILAVVLTASGDGLGGSGDGVLLVGGSEWGIFKTIETRKGGIRSPKQTSI